MVPFHQPGAGSVVSTVSVPALTGVIEMLLGLLVMSQFPIFVAPVLPPSEADEDEFEEPQAASVAAAATALINPRERLKRMWVSSFRGTWRPNGLGVTVVDLGGGVKDPRPRWTPDRYSRALCYGATVAP